MMHMMMVMIIVTMSMLTRAMVAMMLGYVMRMLLC